MVRGRPDDGGLTPAGLATATLATFATAGQDPDPNGITVSIKIAELANPVAKVARVAVAKGPGEGSHGGASGRDPPERLRMGCMIASKIHL